jgi:glycine dehydrogenase
MAAALGENINLRAVGDDRVGLSLDEMTDDDVMARLARALGVEPPGIDATALPDALRRTSPYLTHPVFHLNRAETEMMRLMRRLSDRDLALDRAMIPLGSCTMKLNAAAEMMPLTWPELALHPFAPADQARATGRPSTTSRRSSARSRATTPCPCSPTRARRGSTRDS